MNSALVGIEIGGTKTQIVWGNQDGQILRRFQSRVDRAQGADGIRSQIGSALTAADAPKPTAIGVGFGGPVDWRTGRICCSHQIKGWSEFDLSTWLQQLTSAPVRVDNDANTAALGEAHCGAGRNHDPVFYITLGSGVGGGLVQAGQIYHGRIPGEVEIGHVRLDRDGSTVEDRCSGWAVNRRVLEATRHQPHSRLATLIHDDPGDEARHLGAALQQRDHLAEELLAEIAEDLTFALSHVSHLFHPATIVMGGGLSLLGEPLRTAIARRLPQHIMAAMQPGPAITLAELGPDAVPVGALLLACAPHHL